MKKPKTLSKNSLDMRNLVRHTCPPPTFSFPSKKKQQNKKACRHARNY
jgi:hypothetical protein